MGHYHEMFLISRISLHVLQQKIAKYHNMFLSYNALLNEIYMLYENMNYLCTLYFVNANVLVCSTYILAHKRELRNIYCSRYYKAISFMLIDLQ